MHLRNMQDVLLLDTVVSLQGLQRSFKHPRVGFCSPDVLYEYNIMHPDCNGQDAAFSGPNFRSPLMQTP
jgi:hypothetical protein